MSRRTEAAYVGVPTVEQIPLSVIGGYIFSGVTLSACYKLTSLFVYVSGCAKCRSGYGSLLGWVD